MQISDRQGPEVRREDLLKKGMGKAFEISLVHGNDCCGRSIYLPTYLSIYPSVHSSIHPSTHQPTHPPIYPPICTYIHTCVSVYTYTHTDE